MDPNFPTALIFTLKEEGGYVNDPNDHGGSTDFGITQQTYDKYTGGGKDVSSITPLEVAAIYQQQFWTPAFCGQLSKPLDIVHFDWAVQHGLPQANISLQACFGVHPQDGIVGPKTMAVIASYAVSEACALYIQYRRNWYNAQVGRIPNQAEFLPDWLGRCDRLVTYIAGMMP